MSNTNVEYKVQQIAEQIESLSQELNEILSEEKYPDGIPVFAKELFESHKFGRLVFSKIREDSQVRANYNNCREIEAPIRLTDGLPRKPKQQPPSTEEDRIYKTNELIESTNKLSSKLMDLEKKEMMIADYLVEMLITLKQKTQTTL